MGLQKHPLIIIPVLVLSGFPAHQGNQGNQGKIFYIFPVREKSGNLIKMPKIREKSGNFDFPKTQK